MKVFIYRNVTKKCFSVRACEGPSKGKVIKHVDSFVLSSVTFKVSQAGRNRVLSTNRKNVHAGVVGDWNNYMFSGFASLTKVRYNPYLQPHFFRFDTPKIPLLNTDLVVGDTAGQLYIATINGKTNKPIFRGAVL